MEKQHTYKLTVRWTGNTGKGTSGYGSYERSHIIRIESKADIHASADPVFRGDRTKHNPEELLVASLSACHMLWYLHLCADAGIVVVDYEDNATGIMAESSGRGGRFVEVTLNPVVTIDQPFLKEKANELHAEARKLCFISNSVNFPVHHQPEIRIVGNKRL